MEVVVVDLVGVYLLSFIELYGMKFMLILVEILLLVILFGLLVFLGLCSVLMMVLFGVLWFVVNGCYLWYWYKVGVLFV